jgi:hypothetical protein
MNGNPITHPVGIPKPVRAEIDAFFKAAPFTSVASIAIRSENGFHGVLNIESSESDLLGEDHEATKAACATLQPIAALLSRFT